MKANPREDGAELPVVTALRALSVFSAEQSGAYREHFGALADVLGEDVQTRLGRHASDWARGRKPGALVLTGNAGTGKTAVAEAFCRAVAATLPETDELVEVAPGRWVAKDLSGLPDGVARVAVLEAALAASRHAQVLVCANEGVLRDALEDMDHPHLDAALEKALRHGADPSGTVTVVNVNRQRPTAERLWLQLLDYLTREELWTGCQDCPFDAGGCPMRSNAAALRRGDVREQLRTLVRLGTGEAVPTLREVLAILARAITGDWSCDDVKEANRDRFRDGFYADSGYFALAVGAGLSAEAIERSPLMSGMRRAGLGEVSDLEIDGWLRDTSAAAHAVRALAGAPNASDPQGQSRGRLAGTQSPLDRVRTNQGAMTFHALGEMISTDEDPTRVEDGLDALVEAAGSVPAQALWRQRLYFEAAAELGGPAAAAGRLLTYRHLPELVDLAAKAAVGADTVLEVTELVRGLNFLVTGFSSPDEGLVVPDPACLFARDPGSFRPARPSLVHSQVLLDRLTLAVPDRGVVGDLLDIDHVDVELLVDADSTLSLRIGPRMYEAIRDAADFQGPVGQGVAEMNDLRGFYGRLAAGAPADTSLRVAHPDASPPTLIKVVLPHFAGQGRS